MPHISVPQGLPGITGLMAFRPDTARPLSEFAEQLMRGPSPLSQGERELIAARVSDGNDCHFCMSSHAAAARHALPDDGSLFAAICVDIDTAPLSERMRALLTIADKVRVGGRTVTADDNAAARAAGHDDEAIHDAVLVAAA
ncbi:MAG TPA: peroxidase-related enzyme, partial [Pseudonocardiaceae bacterium]|nr:peroxidase-related enzyme [Pseudonocardiaceae bacterium]